MIRNAATPKRAPISTEGMVPNIYHNDIKDLSELEPVTFARVTPRRSHHLSRDDGNAYWPHNQGR